MKNKEYIMLLIALFVISILIFGIIYANIRIDRLEKRINEQLNINEYLLNRLEGYHG